MGNRYQIIGNRILVTDDKLQVKSGKWQLTDYRWLVIYSFLIRNHTFWLMLKFLIRNSILSIKIFLLFGFQHPNKFLNFFQSPPLHSAFPSQTTIHIPRNNRINTKCSWFYSPIEGLLRCISMIGLKITISVGCLSPKVTSIRSLHTLMYTSLH